MAKQDPRVITVSADDEYSDSLYRQRHATSRRSTGWYQHNTCVKVVLYYIVIRWFLFCGFQTEVVIVSYKITSMHTELLKSKKFGVVIIVSIHFLLILSVHRPNDKITICSIRRSYERVASVTTNLRLISQPFPSLWFFMKPLANARNKLRLLLLKRLS